MRNPFARAAYPAIPLAGAVVLVTGAGRGIGRATADAFARAGARVWIGDLDEPAAVAAAAAIGHDARAMHLDVTARPSFAAFVDAATRAHGRVDVLVNNAGVMPLGSFVDEPDRISRLTLDVNVWGLVLGTRLVLPGMIARGRGHVVNVASMAGKIPIPGMAVYNASKFASVGLTQSIRREVATTGVSVSAVLPAAVRTELVAGVPLGGGLPTVLPEAIAAAVLASVTTRRALTPVPRYLAAWDLIDALLPERLISAGRALVGERRALTAIDPAARRGYDERLARQAGKRG
jgi:NAD(P)-dependent dehydrogenase (short-subunit alcohol dehydrogenase family)